VAFFFAFYLQIQEKTLSLQQNTLLILTKDKDYETTCTYHDSGCNALQPECYGTEQSEEPVHGEQDVEG
jgi:hypothetical protein